MTWYNQLYAHAGWSECARCFPDEYYEYRTAPGLTRYLRSVMQDFMGAYDMGGELHGFTKDCR